MYGDQYFDDGIFQNIIKDDRTSINTVGTSQSGSILIVVCGIISATSSLVIILMIMRSSQRLSTTHHRLVLGASTYELLKSTAMALSTLPIPKDAIYTQFQGEGNSSTCKAQSLTIAYGILGIHLYGIALVAFFLRMTRELLQLETAHLRRACIELKIFERIAHSLCIGVPFLAGTLHFILRRDTLNPAPTRPFCNISAYPYWCDGGSSEDVCSNVTRADHVRHIYSILYVAGIVHFLIALTTTLRFIRSLDSELCTKFVLPLEAVKCQEISQDNVADVLEYYAATGTSDLSRRFSPKFIFQQALAYGFVCIITMFGFSNSSFKALEFFILSLKPLQGFFFLVIFTSNKVYLHLLTYPNISTFRACVHVLTKPIQVIDLSITDITSANGEKNYDEKNQLDVETAMFPQKLNDVTVPCEDFCGENLQQSPSKIDVDAAKGNGLGLGESIDVGDDIGDGDDVGDGDNVGDDVGDGDGDGDVTSSKVSDENFGFFLTEESLSESQKILDSFLELPDDDDLIGSHFSASKSSSSYQPLSYYQSINALREDVQTYEVEEEEEEATSTAEYGLYTIYEEEGSEQ